MRLCLCVCVCVCVCVLYAPCAYPLETRSGRAARGCRANDMCVNAKRKTVSAADVLSAMEELELSDLLPALEAFEACASTPLDRACRHAYGG